MTRLRIGYLATTDPRDRWAFSGTHHYMFKALAARAAVEPLVPLPAPRASRLARLLARVRGVAPTAPEDPLIAAQRAAAALDAQLATQRFDVLFAAVASTVAACHRDPTPLAVLSDATFRLLRADYPELRALPEAVAAARETLEQRTIARADLLLYPSRWAADSAVRDYGADPARVRVIAFGANLDEVPDAAAVCGRLPGPVCRLLFIGRDWTRKGGAVALAAAASLQRLGIPTELSLVGSAPPDGSLPSGVVALGNLDKKRRRDRARLRALLQAAHFLILPTRADCYSMVACEANAFALPVAISAVGGITSLIEDGVNGLLLPPHADGAQYAAALAAVWRVPARYAAMVRGARAAYDTRLNWTSWGDAVSRELVALAAPPRARRVA
jgi:hypothetical protein